EFKTAEFQEGVESLKDLKPGMVLEGVVTNVTNFGAFVDIGVHQDGLVHISALSEKFVKDPYEVVKAGDIVKVKVMEVDIPRNRVGLSMRMSDTPGEKVEGQRGGRPAALAFDLLAGGVAHAHGQADTVARNVHFHDLDLD
ncbi:S1 RNA-binding domain-containing protein, partial [Pseudomonas aeruginosa]